MTTYHGKVCESCGTTERILGLNRCVCCRRRNQREYSARVKEKKQIILTNKHAAIAQKARIYEGLACPRCDNMQRYVKSDNCVTCTRNNMNTFYVKEVKSKTPEEKWAELKPRFRDVKTNDEFKGRSYWV